MNTKKITPKELKSIQDAYRYNPEPLKAFEQDAKRYVKAIRERRVACIIESVSRSGMSRNLKFIEGRKGGFPTFWSFFKALQFSEARNSDAFTVHGCGMDMVFDTNYRICHRLHRFGVITKKTCDKVAQETPVRF